jgi:Fe-S-cluster containining protein
MADERQPWYGTGLRFRCTQCGNCCRNHGEYTHVNLTEPEITRIAARLGLERADFLDRFCTKEPSFHWTLRMDAPACPFLTAENRCSIYPVRPKQCATWPFWTENLDEATWNGPVRATCPGVGRGRLHSAEEVERIARETDEWYEA